MWLIYVLSLFFQRLVSCKLRMSRLQGNVFFSLLFCIHILHTIVLMPNCGRWRELLSDSLTPSTSAVEDGRAEDTFTCITPANCALPSGIQAGVTGGCALWFPRPPTPRWKVSEFWTSHMFFSFSTLATTLSLAIQTAFVGQWTSRWPEVEHLWHAGGSHSHSISNCASVPSSNCKWTLFGKFLLAAISTNTLAQAILSAEASFVHIQRNTNDTCSFTKNNSGKEL